MLYYYRNQEITNIKRQVKGLTNKNIMSAKEFNAYLETLKILALKTFTESEELNEYIKYIEDIQKKLEA